LTRRGVTLLELLVAMVVGGVALSLVSAICVRQQRLFSDLARRSALTGQLREGAEILPIDLRATASGAGDIREARDTSIEIRATVASSIVCDTIAGGVVLAPGDGDPTLATSFAPIEPGDTARIYDARDSTDAWIARRVVAVASANAGACDVAGPTLEGASLAARRTTLMLDSGTATPLIGMPVRVTRARRYSLYRASDGGWYLGARDWNAELLRFNTIQPVSGPYVSAASGGLTLRYFDAGGAELATPVADTRAIALIQFELRGRAATRTAASRIDSVSGMLLLRNRR
jgi:prepilin-type N-terminal cleavage/methylation domain-containing protein